VRSPTFSRLRFEFDEDEKPGVNEAFVVEYDLYLDPAGAPTNWAGANHWIEFGGHAGDDYGAGSKDNEIKFGLIHQADFASWVDYDGTYFQAHIFSSATQFGYTLNAEPAAPTRSSGWHRLRCEVTPTTIGPSDAWRYDFYIDDVLAETITRFGQDGFDWVRLGSGRPTNGHVSFIDNVRVSMVPLEVAGLPCPADCAPAGGNGAVNIDDLLAVINAFGSMDGPCDNAPDNGDGTFGNGIVNIDDLLGVINAFGACL